MVRITAAGIETTEGVREFDIIVWATGFDFGTGALARMGIRGRNGLALDRPLGGRSEDLPRRPDRTAFPTCSSPVAPTRRPATTRATTATRSTSSPTPWSYLRDARLRHHRGAPSGPRSVDEHDRHAGGVAPSFGESSYYFGTNIPGKPVRYLLNSGGRPKLFKEIRGVGDNDYEAFRLSRTGRAALAAEPEHAGRPRQTVATGVTGSPRCRASAAGGR